MTPLHLGTAPAPAHLPDPDGRLGAVKIRMRDAAWRGYHYAQVAGPLLGLDAALLRRRLLGSPEALAELGVCRDARAQHWRRLPADELPGHLEQLVVAEELDGSAEHLERILDRPLDGLPLRVVVGREHVGLHIDHVLGDATGTAKLRRWLVGAATSAEPVAYEPADGVEDPHRVALRHTFDGRPPLGAVRAAVAGALRERRHQAAPGPATDWDGRPSIETAVGGQEARAAVREFRAAHSRGVAGGIVIMSAVWWALREHGVVPGELRPAVGVDMRRYLPRRVHTAGNFATSVRLPEGTSTHPLAVTRSLEGVLSTGVPLVAASAQLQVAGLLSRHRERRVASRTLAGPERPHHQAVSLVLNYTGRASDWESLPWAPGREQDFTAAPSVDSSRGITVNVYERPRSLHIGVSFHDCAVSRPGVRAALDDVQHRLDDVLAALSLESA